MWRYMFSPATIILSKRRTQWTLKSQQAAAWRLFGMRRIHLRRMLNEHFHANAA